MEPKSDCQFSETNWSIVQAARRRPSAISNGALETLCKTYWYPVYAFLRREGQRPPDAMDLTQTLFAQLLRRNALATVRRNKGTFRGWLLTCLKNLERSQWTASVTAKRGGGAEIISWEALSPEERYLHEPKSDITPDKYFDRKWYLEILRVARGKLLAEYAGSGNKEEFEALKDLVDGEQPRTYADLAKILNLSEAALKTKAYRMRKRYRKLIREQIADTVSSESELEEEVKHLLGAVCD